MARPDLRVVSSRPSPRVARPRSFTAAERVIEHLSDLIMADSRGYREIAERCGVGHSTIRNLASRQTGWPRPKTLFAVLVEYGLELSLVDTRRRR